MKASSFPPLCLPTFSQIMRLIVSVSPCPLAFHLSAAFMVSPRAQTQSMFLNVCGFYKGSSYIRVVGAADKHMMKEVL